MKKLLPISITIVLSFVGIANGQSANEAVEALKKLESRVQVGISYKDYGPALGDTHYKVKMYLESPNANKNPILAKSIGNALKHYIYANEIWGYKIAHGSDIIYRDVEQNPNVKFSSKVDGYGKPLDPIFLQSDRRSANTEKMLADEIINKYPAVLKTMPNSYTVSLTPALSVIWNEASKEIQSATKLLYAEKGKTENTESDSTPRPSKLKTKK